jgi:DNA replication protein DnaC
LEIINLQEIQRFYNEKKELFKYQNTYDNNDNGILIIGGSGVGKTTLWLAMAGEKIIKTKIRTKDL